MTVVLIDIYNFIEEAICVIKNSSASEIIIALVLSVVVIWVVRPLLDFDVLLSSYGTYIVGFIIVGITLNIFIKKDGVGIVSFLFENIMIKITSFIIKVTESVMSFMTVLISWRSGNRFPVFHIFKDFLIFTVSYIVSVFIYPSEETGNEDKLKHLYLSVRQLLSEVLRVVISLIYVVLLPIDIYNLIKKAIELIISFVAV